MEIGKIEILGEAEPFVSPKNGHKYHRLRIRCFCGKEFVSHANSIKFGHTKSCGCLRWRVRLREDGTFDNKRTTHGLTNHPLFRVWTSMKQRCYTEKSWSYKWYGARGIKICEEWRDDVTAFFVWSMENGYKRGLEIDRIDNDGNYSPENCRFVTSSQNLRNTRRRTMVTFNGVTKHLQEWANELGFTYSILYSRLFTMKLPPEIAFLMVAPEKHIIMDKDISNEISNILKSEGRKQRWLMSKMVEKGINTDDVKISNQIKGITGFTEREIEAINEILGTTFNVELGTE